MKHPAYRPEIDGLRALSVVIVLLYHLGVPPFYGGFVGVDVFFVISGYLITRLIVIDIEAKSFSFARFCVRRVRRLFPALFVTVFVTFAAALLWFPPDALRNTALHVVMSLLSASNIQFWLDQHAYFVPDLRLLPLLHTWSLGVEDQFYLVWPLALMLTARFLRISAIPLVILVVTVVSLLLCQFWLFRDPAAAFYLAHNRMFELGTGAFCVYVERSSLRLPADLFLACGMLAILASVVLLDAATPFPGIHALAPTLGAGLIVVAGERARASLLLTNRLAVGIGLISYSLYLCHWPLIVFWRYVHGELGPLSQLMLACLALALAFLMYRLIERPFRYSTEPATSRNLIKLATRCAAVASIVIVPAMLALAQGGFEWRLSDQREALRIQRFG